MSTNSVSTTNCSNYQHPEFLLVFDSLVPQCDIDVLASFLEKSVEQGTQYDDGDTIAFGSMLFLVASVDNLLILHEPDLQSLPIAWKLGITQSMKLLRLQKDVVESVGLEDEIDSPSIRSSLLIGTDLTDEGKKFILERITPVDSDSGWFIGRPDSMLDYNNEVNLNRISIYQAIMNWPQIAPFLALPAGCRIDVSEANSIFTRNGKSVAIHKTSLGGVKGWAGNTQKGHY
jgi:hypothetical protein